MRVLEGKAARECAQVLINRAAVTDRKVNRAVEKIVSDVRRKGESALRNYAEKFDGLPRRQALLVSREEMQDALRSVSPQVLSALKHAAKNIRQFAEWQKPKPWMHTIEPGVRVGQKVEPLNSVGCYVPGGRYPLPSSLLMTVIPAQVAGVRFITVASPRPAPETLAAAALLGVETFFRVGGAQAIAALAYGAATAHGDEPAIYPVQKIVGPGNSYVTAAKKLVAFDCAIDMLAGPTEILYFADKGDARFIASDLAAQAEHDPETLPIFVTTNAKLARQVADAAISAASDNAIAYRSLNSNGVALVFKTRDQALGFANAIGAEHITVDDPDSVSRAGSIFIGPYSAQALGDYVSGPNHVLPTGNVARFRGGLSIADFLKVITVQEVTKRGLKRIGPTAITLAEAEGLKAHADSIRVRLQ
jgi:histidinol dehydrogenase